MAYPPSWRTLTLHYLGATPNDQNMLCLSLWAASEGVPAWVRNPLAYTQPVAGSRPYNSSRVQVYPSADTCARLYARAFRTSLYRAIGDALITSQGLDVMWTAINLSPWCAHCQGGRYPIALYDYLHGHANLVTGQGIASHGQVQRPLAEPNMDYSHYVHGSADTANRHAQRFYALAQAIRGLGRHTTPGG